MDVLRFPTWLEGTRGRLLGRYRDLVQEFRVQSKRMKKFRQPGADPLMIV
jgi:hypothetical protein